MSGAVVAFGEVLLRLGAPGSSRLLQQPALEAIFGGAEFNVLASLARLGLATEMVTALPENALGLAACGEMRRHGVGVRHVRHHDARMGLYFLEAGASLRAGRVVYDRAGSAFASLDPASLDWPAILEKARWLHLTGISAALGERPWTAMLDAVRAARRLDIPCSFDVNMRPSLWAVSKRSPRETLRPLLEQATLIFAGSADWNTCLDDETPERTDTAFLERMLSAYPQAQAIISSLRRSHGADHHELSALAMARGAGLARARGIAIHNAVDRVGAGDAFAAGVLARHFEGASWREALDFGVAAGALKHTVPGDVNRVSRAEIEAVLAGDDGGRLSR